MLAFKVGSISNISSTLNSTSNIKKQVYTGKCVCTYVLPIATAEKLGGVKIGSNINEDTYGVINVLSLTNSEIENIMAN